MYSWKFLKIDLILYNEAVAGFFKTRMLEEEGHCLEEKNIFT